jgi:hypothetical protein
MRGAVRTLRPPLYRPRAAGVRGGGRGEVRVTLCEPVASCVRPHRQAHAPRPPLARSYHQAHDLQAEKHVLRWLDS